MSKILYQDKNTEIDSLPVDSRVYLGKNLVNVQWQPANDEQAGHNDQHFHNLDNIIKSVSKEYKLSEYSNCKCYQTLMKETSINYT